MPKSNVYSRAVAALFLMVVLLSGVSAFAEPPSSGRQRIQASPQVLPAVRRAATGGGSDLFTGMARDVFMDIASNGDIFLAQEQRNALTLDIETVVLRSQDGGESFQEIQVFSKAFSSVLPNALDVVEGDQDRVYLALYEEFPGTLVFAYSDLSTVTGTWSTTSVASIPGLPNNPEADLCTDALEYPDYYLYMAWASPDADGDDIWFSRSLDFGATWSSPYKIGDNVAGANTLHFRPRIAFGNDTLHAGWTYGERNQDTFDDAVFYRRALNYADAGLGDWDPVVTMYPTNDGLDQRLYELEASSVTGDVLLIYAPTAAQRVQTARASFDSGSTWPAGNEMPVGFLERCTLTYRPGSAEFVVSGRRKFLVSSFFRNEFGYRTIQLAAPNITFGSIEILEDAPSTSPASERSALAVDPSHGEQVALLWIRDENPFFDAEWRTPLLFPRPEQGFPFMIDSPGSSPAIADIDSDGDGEVIFGALDGTIRVLEHDGTIRAGWPQPTGSAGHRAAVAVGDLNGDASLEIVAATADGRVWSFGPDGQPNLGWPVDLGTGAAAYPCIGAIGAPYTRHVVVVSGNRLFALSYRGEDRGFAWTFSGIITQPPAVGDLDGDQVAEIVVVQGEDIFSVNLASAVITPIRTLSGKTISGPAALADLDNDGDLEIVIPTLEGDVYVVHHTGADVSGWPYSNPAGGQVYPVAVAQNLGTTEPDVSFVQADGSAHLLTHAGVEQSSYPVQVKPSFGGVIVAPVNRSSSNLVVAGTTGMVSTVENLGGVPPGWPRYLGDQSWSVPAAGDIDLDGRVELVVLTNSEVRVWEMEQGPDTAQRQWPMYGYDAQRTSCLACDEDVVTAVGPDTQISTSVLRAPYPNPAVSIVQLSYSLAARSGIRLEVFDLRGRRVRTLRAGEFAAGNHRVIFDGRDHGGELLARGVYLVRLRVHGEQGNEDYTRKITWAR
ncbi:hypothetical protein DRQ53_12795 [bacterium]|nr:MAG: hypothetical protein DRQ53_12795 [bacterium]